MKYVKLFENFCNEEISPIAWSRYVRDKRKSEEDTMKKSPFSAIEILQSVKNGEVENIKPIGGSNKNPDPQLLRKVNGFEFSLRGHEISVQHRQEFSTLGFKRDIFLIFVDNENIKADSDTVEKIIKKLKNKI
jgi:hypothetical protein